MLRGRSPHPHSRRDLREAPLPFAGSFDCGLSCPPWQTPVSLHPPGRTPTSPTRRRIPSNHPPTIAFSFASPHVDRTKTATRGPLRSAPLPLIPGDGMNIAPVPIGGESLKYIEAAGEKKFANFQVFRDHGDGTSSCGKCRPVPTRCCHEIPAMDIFRRKSAMPEPRGLVPAYAMVFSTGGLTGDSPIPKLDEINRRLPATGLAGAGPLDLGRSAE